MSLQYETLVDGEVVKAVYVAKNGTISETWPPKSLDKETEDLLRKYILPSPRKFVLLTGSSLQHIFLSVKHNEKNIILKISKKANPKKVLQKIATILSSLKHSYN